MTHLLVSRINFTDRALLNQYLKITKEILIPALKSQTNQNFTWMNIINQNDEEYLRKELDFPFIATYGSTDFIKYIMEKKPNIQTRHDCDDWMSNQYIESIQSTYREKIKKHDMFIIHAQPTKLDYHSGIEKSLPKYHDLRCSMFLSLCQKKVNHHVNERKHGQMYELTKNITLLPEGYCKWVIHGNNKSVKK